PHREKAPDKFGKAFQLPVPAVFRAEVPRENNSPSSFVLTLRPDGLYFFGQSGLPPGRRPVLSRARAGVRSESGDMMQKVRLFV
ncbi:MAG: hypothetical protein D3924_09080, partial [Candidatus Electrothrix sp. AR4]|nr:hypothetical protein [Candidatus Electrothrix sp. AR4]